MNTEQIWNDFSDGLQRYIRARVPTEADADDVLQEVFVKIIAREQQLREQERLAGWVFRIASNAVHDHYRGSRRDLPSDFGDSGPGNLKVLEELSFCVEPFVDALDEPYRSALRMTEIEGMTQAEAAAQAGISVSGMKSRVQRGRANLRGVFEQCCDVELDARNRIVGYEPRCQGCD